MRGTAQHNSRTHTHTHSQTKGKSPLGAERREIRHSIVTPGRTRKKQKKTEHKVTKYNFL